MKVFQLYLGYKSWKPSLWILSRPFICSFYFAGWRSGSMINLPSSPNIFIQLFRLWLGWFYGAFRVGQTHHILGAYGLLLVYESHGKCLLLQRWLSKMLVHCSFLSAYSFLSLRENFYVSPRKSKWKRISTPGFRDPNMKKGFFLIK